MNKLTRRQFLKLGGVAAGALLAGYGCTSKPISPTPTATTAPTEPVAPTATPAPTQTIAPAATSASTSIPENTAPAMGDYFGQTPPGDKAVIFAPGIISQGNRMEFNIAFTPDGNECYFMIGEFINNDFLSKIYCSKRVNNTWTEKVEAPFSVNQNVSLSRLSADGNRLYFEKDYHIWMVERTTEGWGEPQRLPSPINSDFSEVGYSETADGVVYISSDRSGNWDLYRIHPLSDVAENFGLLINSTPPQSEPCIAPDGSYLIFSKISGDRPGLFISFNKGDNEWTLPIDMNKSGAGINVLNQGAPSLSPDGKYLFFNRHSGYPYTNVSDIYWVSTHIIEGLKEIAFAAQ